MMALGTLDLPALAELQQANDNLKAFVNTFCDGLREQRIERQKFEEKLKTVESQLSDASQEQDDVKRLLEEFAAYTLAIAKAEELVRAVLDDLEARRTFKERTEAATASSESQDTTAEGKVEKKNRLGRTELHNAVCSGDKDYVQQLLKNRASVDATDGSGRTPLHLAASELSEPVKIIELLLEARARTEAKDLSGFTPLNLACDSKCKEAVAVLQSEECHLYFTVRNNKHAVLERNKVLNSDLESAVNKGLATTFTTKFTEKWQGRVDKTFFCEIFEKELLRFSKLTRHQHEKLGDVENLLNGGPVHLSAPAGSGKTFIAVQCAYKKIKQSSEGVLSFVAPSIDLGLYFFQWLAQRFGEHMSVHDLLSRVVLMQAPYESFMTLHDEDGRLITKPSEGEPQFLLTIVDEAHDVFQSIDYDRFFHKVKAEQRLLLSSKSQASGTDVVFAGAKEVKLTEIVRTTKRIVAGARVDFEKYGQKTITALWDLIGTYAGLSFHQRLAMLVPNDTFLTGFKEQIRRLLAQFPGRNFKLTSFRDSLAILANQETKQTAEALIIDTVANAKGLEKLIIICIGLDEKLGDQKTNCETRALIYQALTRAQLQVVVVNQLLPGGWFEFLGKVKFKEDIFDESSAMKETTTQAASQSISQTVPSVESRAAASDRHPPSPGRIASSATQRDSHVPPVREPEPPIVSTDQGIDQLKEQDSSVWDTDNDFDTKQIQRLQFDPRKAWKVESC
ncbi:unnamed protein product [Cladocopium goreaui]|uniref:Ankyrin repeat domain-containing protein 54 n=1 Tax=Cladocopium goreaui TaxID=2562237 RepID=A0A9P1D465_9DINO|nr:unnamed protein product [Cladocopium goreaui]